jgi:hypothetical protein
MAAARATAPAGDSSARRGTASASAGDLLLDAGLTALLAGISWAVLGWLSAGPAGPGRLAHVGPSAWQLGSAVVVEVGLGACLAVGLGLGLRKVRSWQELAQGD